MLPSARLSLPSRTQKKLFAFSGSSVASGARTSERTSGSMPSRLGDVDQLLDEQVRAADDRGEADDQLKHDRRPWRLVAGRPVHVKGSDRVRLLHGAAAAQGRADVDRVGEDEDDRERQVDPLGDDRPDQDPGGEEDEEEDQVAVERRHVGVQLRPLLAARMEDQRRDPDKCHRDRREQERGADDRSDRDVLGALGATDDRDDRDQRLRHRRADRGEDASRRALADTELVPRPLDRVGEEQRAGEDDREADREEGDFHRCGLPATLHELPDHA